MQAPNDISAVRRAYDVLRKAYNEQPYLDAEAREDLLHRLEKMLLKYDDEFVKAMSDDFGFRNAFESRTADVLIPLDSARYARKHVREWMQRRTVNSHPARGSLAPRRGRPRPDPTRQGPARRAPPPRP